jgi:hypothetical protein
MVKINLVIFERRNTLDRELTLVLFKILQSVEDRLL